MDNIFLVFGLACFSWYLTKLIFWLDEPTKEK